MLKESPGEGEERMHLPNYAICIDIHRLGRGWLTRLEGVSFHIVCEPIYMHNRWTCVDDLENIEKLSVEINVQPNGVAHTALLTPGEESDHRECSTTSHYDM